MRQKEIASWNEMPQLTAASIMSGRPVGAGFVLQPRWIIALMAQNLLERQNRHIRKRCRHSAIPGSPSVCNQAPKQRRFKTEAG